MKRRITATAISSSGRRTAPRDEPSDRARSAADPSYPPSESETLRGREVLLCVSGGIAAYKSAYLVSRLVQAGCGVTVALTRAARRFITPLTFQALSGRPVYTSLWPDETSGDIRHLSLGQNADLIVVAPATANTIGKLAGGIADDLVSSILIGAACDVLLAPAMNTNMWAHAAVQRNVALLRDAGVGMIGPDEGWQACRAVGPGRMAEPDAILAEIVRRLGRRRRT